MTELNTHLVVVGSGVAGLYSALLAAEAGVRVTLLTKARLADSNTHFAQGGICAVLGPGDAAPGDTVQAHIADTLKAGAGQCDLEAVRILCTEAAGDIAAVERFGVAFDTDAAGRRSLGLEGAHSAARILHAGGDATGAAIANGLIRAVLAAAGLGTITVVEDAFVHDLLLSGRQVAGVRYQSAGGPLEDLSSDGVLLATGGAGRLFETTTNPAVATADGVALAWRAGAVLADLEYFQFHPTALAVGGGFLISEAVRGAGAVLRDSSGEPFMAGYHPKGDLAPRDVVARSMAAQMRKGGGGPPLFLDATGVEAVHGEGYLGRRFPTIEAATRALGFDWSRQWLPVTPAAHYWMGGVATNSFAQTSLPGLFAAGEVACTGVHGANRLASNSLLEGLVFGRRAVAAFMGQPVAPHNAQPAEKPVFAQEMRLPLSAPEASDAEPLSAEPLSAEPFSVEPFSIDALGRLMGAHAGVVRDEAGLRHAAAVLAGWRPRLGPSPDGPVIANWKTTANREDFEAMNLLTVAQLLVHAALSRESSVGAHFRSDFPRGPANTPAGAPANPSAGSPCSAGARESQHWVNPVPIPTTATPRRESETV